MSVSHSARCLCRAAPKSSFVRRVYPMSGQQLFSTSSAAYASRNGQANAAQQLIDLSEQLQDVSTPATDLLDMDSPRTPYRAQNSANQRVVPERGPKYKNRISIGYQGQAGNEIAQPLANPTGESSTKANLTSNTGDSSIPWYLQGQSSAPKTSTSDQISDRQRIPPLPNHSPPLLEPLMKYISTDLGLDYLTLMDLRSIDPPSALGANLIMLVGSARGEKHLHISADRCCRWLRSNYKLRPQADGLLGRQELKVKMRRRTKRLKILASAGATEHEEADDGIRTGWVCLSVSDVQPAESEGGKKDQAIAYPEGFIGFGESPNQIKIVVQMMTEEMREEVDIETLWENRVRKQEKQMSLPDGQLTDMRNHLAADTFRMPKAGTSEALVG